MASINSYADIVGDWTSLLEATERTPDVQPIIDGERQALKQALSEAQGLKARQDELTALRQEVTQQLRGVLTRGKDTAMQMRSMAKGKIGPRNERLVLFKVAPLRKRARKGAVVVKPPDGESPGTEPGVSTPRR